MEILKIPNKLRRDFMILINKNHIKNKILKRKGKCKKCGKCCKGCTYLDEKTKLCKVYSKRPDFCYKEFPLDEMDKKVFNVKNCGFYFK